MIVVCTGDASVRFDRDYYANDHFRLAMACWERYGLQSVEAFFPYSENGDWRSIGVYTFFEKRLANSNTNHHDPRPIGIAATTPDPMSAHALPILYSFRRCPYAMRARFALAASGVPCELREVVLRAKPAELLAASPKGTVPVLVLPDGRVIEQSMDIMRWALAQCDPEQWLMPERGGAAEMDSLIQQCDGPFKVDLDRYKYPDRHAGADPVVHRAAGAEYLAKLDARVHGAGYLLGSRPCLADMAIAPFVRQFAHVDAEWFAAQPWPALRRWLEAFLADARFRLVMEKTAPWVPRTEGVRFPPDK
jgi:glutathione S-transferase